jgi:hypothetical protein
MIDHYTKAILTVTAACLVVIVIKDGIAWVSPATAPDSRCAPL